MNKRKLKLGEDYAVRIVLPGYKGPGHPNPRVVIYRRMQLIDIRSNGWVVVAEDRMTWSWDTNKGSFHDAMAGRISKTAVRKTALRNAQSVDLVAPWAQWTLGKKVPTGDGGMKLEVGNATAA